MHIEVENLTEMGRPFAHIYGAGALDLADDCARLTGEMRISGRASRQRERSHTARRDHDDSRDQL